MRLLTISLSTSLFDQKSDAFRRHTRYADQLDHLYVIVMAASKERIETKTEGKLTIIPAYCRTRLGSVLKALRAAKRICREKKIDLISTQDPFATAWLGWKLKKKFSIPLNIQVHFDFIDNPFWIGERFINPYLNTLGKKMLVKADSVRTVSQTITEKVRKLGLDQSRIYTIPLGIDTRNFMDVDGSEIRAQYKTTADSSIVLFVGILIPQKNIPLLIKAAAIVIEEKPDTLFLIAGDGGEREKLEKMSASQGLSKNIIFLGRVPESEVINYYAACDIFLMTSVYEGTARALMEAAAAAKPIVTTAVSGAKDAVIDGETGYIVPINDARELARRIIELLSNPQRRKTMGQKAREIISTRFSREKTIQDLNKM